MIAYKGTKNSKCLNIPYEVGKTYKIDSELIMCEKGFHYCENLIDVHGFYSFENINTVILEIEVLGDVIKDGVKSITNKFKVIRIIPKTEYCKISPENFDKNGNRIYYKNFNGWVKCEFDEKNNLIKAKNSNGYWLKCEYDEKNNLIKAEDSNGDWKKLKYDEKNNLIEERGSNNCWVKYKYDEKNNLIKIESYNGFWKKFKYDENNNLIKIEQSNDFWKKFEYDEYNNLVCEESSDGYWRKYEYNGNTIYYEDSFNDKYLITIS